MTTPAGTIGYNDVNAEMGLSPRVISSTYRYVNFLEGHNPAEVAWSRLRNKSRIWNINDDLTLPPPVNKKQICVHTTPTRDMRSYWPATLGGDSFTVIYDVVANWGSAYGQTASFTIGTAMEHNSPMFGIKGVFQGKFVYDGGFGFYCHAWKVFNGGSDRFSVKIGVRNITYLPRI